MKVLILGDVHGDTHAVINVINKSKHIDYSKIVQVGDFGLWDHLEKGVKFLDDINVTLSHFGRTLYAIGGNHENWDHWNWYVNHLPKDEDGFAILRRHVRLAPRIHRWYWGDGVQMRKFQGAAGAASIDKAMRLAEMRNGRPASWWWQEMLTDEEVASVPAVPADYLITHDCSNATPWGFQLVPDPDSQIHRQKIDTILKKVQPKMHFHGHMHHKYEWMNRIDGDKWVETFGLDCNGTLNSWGVLDTVTNQFAFNRDPNPKK